MKRALRLFLCLAVISTPLTALAERLEVFRWQALEGKGEQLVGALLQAAIDLKFSISISASFIASAFALEEVDSAK